MAPQRKPVVVGLDGSAAGLHAVHWAARRASREGVPLRIVHAYHLPPGCPPGVTAEEPVLGVLRREAKCLLGEARAAATAVVPSLDVTTELTAAPPRIALVSESENASVLVFGDRDHSAFAEFLGGSTSLALANHAHCPVVLVRGGAGRVRASGPVVVGVDDTPAGDAAIAFAFAEAASANTALVALHAYARSVFEPAFTGGAEVRRQRAVAADVLAERLAGWRERYPQVRVEQEVVHDRPAPTLRRRAPTARLVVVGRRGPGGLRELVLGSTSQQLLHHADCPVAVVRMETVFTAQASSSITE